MPRSSGPKMPSDRRAGSAASRRQRALSFLAGRSRMIFATVAMLAVVATALLASCGWAAHVVAPDHAAVCVVAAPSAVAPGTVGPAAVAMLATALAPGVPLAAASSRAVAVIFARAVGWPPGDPLHGTLLI